MRIKRFYDYILIYNKGLCKKKKNIHKIITTKELKSNCTALNNRFTYFYYVLIYCQSVYYGQLPVHHRQQ